MESPHKPQKPTCVSVCVCTCGPLSPSSPGIPLIPCKAHISCGSVSSALLDGTQAELMTLYLEQIWDQGLAVIPSFIVFFFSGYCYYSITRMPLN